MFKSSSDPGAALGTGFNAYYSIEGIQMDEAQHENCEFTKIVKIVSRPKNKLLYLVQIGTMGLASFKTTCETSCTTVDVDGNDVTDQACLDNVSNCVDDAILNLATCILPTISGTPATP